MTPTAEALADAVAAESRSRIAASVEKIRHCVGQLSEEQIWWRPHEQANAVGNIILHLCGNLRQWIVAALGGAADVRRRPDEFSRREPMSAGELLRGLSDVAVQCDAVLSAVTAEELLRRRRVQGFDVSGLGAIFDSVPHLGGHTQEIVFITRLQLGDAYTFHWSPSTPEEGSPA